MSGDTGNEFQHIKRSIEKIEAGSVRAAGKAAMGAGFAPGSWHIVTDAKGFDSIHASDEDGLPGDLVAHVFGDHAATIGAAPDVCDALEKLVTRLKLHFLRDQFPGWGGDLIANADAALAKARGEQSNDSDDARAKHIPNRANERLRAAHREFDARRKVSSREQSNG